MSLKMQADINLLQAHYDELDLRIAEIEEKVDLLNRGIHTLLGGGDIRRLKLVKEDKTPTPRTRTKNKKK
jgi:cell division protein FtsB